MPDANLTLTAIPAKGRSEIAVAAPLPDVLRQVEHFHLQCEDSYLAGIVAAFEAGQLLIDARASVPHGQWERAVGQTLEELGLSITLRTCQRYMELTRRLTSNLKCPSRARFLSSPETTRMSFLEMLRKRGVNSINEALKLGKKSTNAVVRKKPPTDSRAVNLPTNESASRELPSTNFAIPEPVAAAAATFLSNDCALIHHAGTEASLPTIGQRFFASGEDLLAECNWQGQLFAWPSEETRIEPIVQRAVGEFVTASLDAALLILPARHHAPWASLLDSYPQVFLRNGLPGDLELMLVGIVTTEQWISFANTFDLLGPVFFPFPGVLASNLL